MRFEELIGLARDAHNWLLWYAGTAASDISDSPSVVGSLRPTRSASLPPTGEKSTVVPKSTASTSPVWSLVHPGLCASTVRGEKTGH